MQESGSSMKVCRGGQRYNEPSREHATATNVQDSESTDGSAFTVYNIRSVRPPIMVPLSVNGKPLQMELDTASGVSLIGETTAAALFPECHLKPTSARLQDYNRKPIQVKGQMDVTVSNGKQVITLQLLGAKGSRATLLGRNWLDSIQLDWTSILSPVHKVSDTRDAEGIDSLKAEFPQVFSPGLGEWKGPPARIRLNPELQVVPRFFKPRPVPMALREKVEETLDSMVASGVLEPIDHSEWAAPIVCVPKPNGEIRVCGDFKVTVNPYLHVDQYPMPTMEETLLPLTGAVEYSVLDMSQAFLQIPIDSVSQQLLVINTHTGLFRYKRLAFGVAPASAILQEAGNVDQRGSFCC